MTPVDLNELLDAIEYVSSVITTDAAAYVSRETGQVYFVGTDLEPEDALPDDIDAADRYVAIPSKQDLDLGRPVALRFAEAHLPEHYGTIFAAFSHAGAYSKFKDLLERHGQLAAWYDFESKAQRKALSDWCAAQGFDITNPDPSRTLSR